MQPQFAGRDRFNDDMALGEEAEAGKPVTAQSDQRADLVAKEIAGGFDFDGADRFGFHAPRRGPAMAIQRLASADGRRRLARGAGAG